MVSAGEKRRVVAGSHRGFSYGRGLGSFEEHDHFPEAGYAPRVSSRCPAGHCFGHVV